MTAAAASQPAVVPQARRTDLATRLFYGSGSMAFGVKDNGFSYLLLPFFNQVIGLPASLVGLALLIALVFDACIDPMIGQVWKQKLLPDRALARMWDFEDSHAAWKRYLALHHLFVLRRR